MKNLKYFFPICLLIGIYTISTAQPINLCTDNPHYLFYKNKPVVLITSAEHYGAVINNDFNYIRYLDMLHSFDLNYTRIYPGYLIEPEGLYMEGNTLAPPSKALVLPWARSEEPGYASGGNKFNLEKWNPAFFSRLHDFIKKAEERNIIVEVCFFNAMSDVCWDVSPLNSKNNINGIGTNHFNYCQTIKDTALLRIEANYVKRILQEINKYDNVILEICDETTVHGTPLNLAAEWTQYMIDLIKDTENSLPKKHLIAQQIIGHTNGLGDFSENNDISIIVGQYAGVQFYGDGRATYFDAVQEGGLLALDDKYKCNKVIEFNETYYYPMDYKVDPVADSRVEGWEFIVGGGGSFNHLNGRFNAKQPDGNTPDNIQVLTSFKNLISFINGVDYTHMYPDRNFIEPMTLNHYAFWRALGNPGKQYIMYMHHSFLEYNAYRVVPNNYITSMELNIPAGKYRFEWIDPQTGKTVKSEDLECITGKLPVCTPEHSVDIALRVTRII